MNDQDLDDQDPTFSELCIRGGQAMLVCLEMFLAAWAHRSVFSYKPYEARANKTFLEALLEIMSPADVVIDVRTVARVTSRPLQHKDIYSTACEYDPSAGECFAAIPGRGAWIGCVAHVGEECRRLHRVRHCRCCRRGYFWRGRSCRLHSIGHISGWKVSHVSRYVSGWHRNFSRCERPPSPHPQSPKRTSHPAGVFP